MKRGEKRTNAGYIENDGVYSCMEIFTENTFHLKDLLSGASLTE